MAARAATLEGEALNELLAEGRRRLPNTVLRPDNMPVQGYGSNINRGW